MWVSFQFSPSESVESLNDICFTLTLTNDEEKEGRKMEKVWHKWKLRGVIRGERKQNGTKKFSTV